MKLANHHDARVEFLKTVSLFEGLHRRQLEHVRTLVTAIDEPAGTVLCKEGQRGQEFFIIRTGRVDVSTGNTLGPGEFFGEMALIDDQPRRATVITTEPTELFVLSRQEFREMRRVDPSVVRKIEATIRARQPVTTSVA